MLTIQFNNNNDIQSKNYFFIVVVISFIYNLYSFPNTRKFVSLILLIFMAIYYVYEKPQLSSSFNKSKSHLKNTVVTKILKNIINYTDNIIFPNVYPISKVPKKFIFISKSPYLYDIIFDLRFLERFNKDAFYKIIILLEYFCKFYYKTIANEYEYDIVIDMLVAIRKQILNLLNEQVFSIPVKLNLPNTDYDIENTDEYIKSNTDKIRAFTHKKLKILANKDKINSNKKKFGYKAPFQANLFNNKHEIF